MKANRTRGEEGTAPLRAGIVTALEPQAKHAERYNLYIDDHFVLGLSAFVASQVRVGQRLDLKQLEQLARTEQVERAHEAALRRLETRPRSEAEIRSALAVKGFSADVCDEVVRRLADAGLVDDRDFARFWVENREGFRPRSARALKYELRRKGVSNEEISRVVRGVDEADSAYRAARPKAERLRNLDSMEFRNKLSGFLGRRGYDYQVIRNTVTKLWKELNTDSPDTDEEIE